MCVVSMVMNQGLGWPQEYWRVPTTLPIFEGMYKAAKKYDRENGEPDCELEDKKFLLSELAKKLNVTINFPGDESHE